LIDPNAGTATRAFNTQDIVPPESGLKSGAMPQLMTINSRGTRLYVSLFQSGQIAAFDITDPYHLRVVQTVDLGEGAGPHSLLLANDGRRLVASDYFLNEDNAGKVHLEGDHKVRAFWVSEEGTLTADQNFQLDFNHAFPTGPARPHGMAVKRVRHRD
jgi:selenium-binding protein 1